MTGNISDGEIEKHLIAGRRVPYMRPNPNLIPCDVLTNVSTNKAVSICDSTFEGVVFWLIY
jgi:hypothetical protein